MNEETRDERRETRDEETKDVPVQQADEERLPPDLAEEADSTKVEVPGPEPVEGREDERTRDEGTREEETKGEEKEEETRDEGRGEEGKVEEKVEEEFKEVVKEEVKEEIKAVEEKKQAPAEVEVLESEPPKEEEVKRWYIVQTLTGYEERVKRAIERSIADANLSDKILNVLIPEEEVVEIRNNRRIEKVRKMYPGYIFVEMILSEETWYTIRQTPGVARFIGSKVKPVPVTDREMQRVLKQLGVKEEMVEVEFEVGESIRVISGPFRGYSGSVNDINPGKNKIKVLINIFGRDTPVEIDFDQAEKIV